MEKEQRKWYLLDAKNQVLGRLSVKIANLLRGKEKVGFVPYKDMGDYVVVKNAHKIKVTGKKMEQKTYFRHSGYIGSLKQITLKNLLKEKPEEVIRHAVSGMLPKNKLKKFWLKRLRVYASEDHPDIRHLVKLKKIEKTKHPIKE